jgi:hypothetical protein
VAIAALFLFPGLVDAHQQTLGGALSAAGVPTTGATQAELATPLTGWTSSHDGASYLLAYRVTSKSKQSVIHVLRYDRNRRHLERTMLTDEPRTRARFQRGQLMISCMGSPVAIAQRGRRVYLDTHLTPSAGCVLVLDQRLQIASTLCGWIIGYVGDRFAVVRESEIHFEFPEGQLALSVYDAATDRATPLYPVAGDPTVRAFDIVMPIAVSPSAQAFSVQTSYPNPERPAFDYEFAYAAGHWKSRSFHADGLKEQFGVSSLDELMRTKPLEGF